MKKKIKYTVFGHTGFLGSNIVNYLKKQNYDVFLPNRTPCGPLKASTRSISNRPVLYWRPLAKWTPSTNKPTDCSNDWLAPAPIPLIEIMVEIAFSDTAKFGMYWDMPLKSWNPASWIFSPLRTLTETQKIS